MDGWFELLNVQYFFNFIASWLKENWLIQIVVVQSGICLVVGKYLKYFVASNLHEMENKLLKYTVFIFFYALFYVVASIFMIRGLVWALMIVPYWQRTLFIITAIISISVIACFQSMKWFDGKHLEAKRSKK